MTHRLFIISLVCILVAGLLASVAPASPRAMVSPPGQIKIITANTRQNAVLGIKRFEDMFELSQALRKRPTAFDGGYNGGIHAPDIVVTQEMRPSNLEIFEHLLRQRYQAKYRIAGLEDAASQIIYNSDTVALVGEPKTWEDVCLGETTAGNRQGRFYQAARFTEVATGAPFTVAGMHMPKSFFNSGQADCYMDNLQEFRTQLEDETGAVFVAGDFNKRSVEVAHECDSDENSPELPWYTAMTQPTDGKRLYVDTVRQWHRQRGIVMADEWTHEQKSETLTCDGATRYRRSRVDYIFQSGAITTEAHADHPGWAGLAPGTKRKGFHKYSDHRFVFGRFVLTGPPKPLPPSAIQAKDGRIELSWTPVEGATEYIVLRSVGGRAFSELVRTDGTITSYVDEFTEHGVTYAYAIAPVGPDSGQGFESLKTRQSADSRGPKVASVTPGSGATGVDRRTNIRVVFDSGVKPESVTGDRIRLVRGRTLITGTLRIESRRVIEFDPDFALRPGTRYSVKVKPVQDRLGNVGGGKSWEFYTYAKPRKRRR